MKFLIAFLLISNFLFSQNLSGDGIIFGKISDSKTTDPLEYVSVRLFNQVDSSLVTGAFTTQNGKFNFERIANGNYFIRLSLIEYEDFLVPDITLSASLKIINLGTLRLIKEKISNLNEVKIEGKLNLLQTGIDKKVYNVGEDISVRGGTTNDILNRLPSVEVDQEGRVMLRGEGTVIILIDGRPSSLSGGNGKTLLDALPASSVERIEIVTNPSAKYDPDGTSGIINIVLKKNKLKGFNGLVSSNIGSGNIKNGNVLEGSLSLSYRNAGFNVYGSYNERYLDGFRDNNSYIKQSPENGITSILDQKRTGEDLNAGRTFRLGADFNLKERNTIGFSTTGNIGQRDRTGDLWNSSFDGIGNLTQFWQRTSYDPSQQKNIDVNVNYKYDLKKQRGNLIVDLNQSFGNDATQGFYEENYFNLDSSISSAPSLLQQLFNKEKNNITTAQLDFSYLLPKISARIETGAKMILRNQKVDTYSEEYDALSQQYIENNIANFLYSYDEQIYSLYSIFGQQLGKFKYQGGIRLEKSYQIPNLISDTIRIVNDYFNFFPSAHLRYSFSKKSELGLSYSKRITRAGSGELNPFTSYSDPLNLRKGNPYLQPEFINSFDLSYTLEEKKLSFSASTFYRNNTAVISRVKEFYPDSTSAVTYKNISETNSLGTEFTINYKPFLWWRTTFSYNGNYIWYISNLEDLPNREGYNHNFKVNSTIDFWKKTASIQLSYAYNGPRITIQGTAQRTGPFDIAFEKKLMEGKWSVGTRVSDIFNQQGFNMELTRAGIYQSSEFKWLTRRIYLTLSYKFGKLEISNKNKMPGTEGGDN
jgi:outer membrane receptor protein involved in Fe transport